MGAPFSAELLAALDRAAGVGRIRTEADLAAFVRQLVPATPTPSTLALPQVEASAVANGRLFCDIADGVAKFKDATGNSHALY